MTSRDIFFQTVDILLQIKIAMFYKNITQKDIAENTGINLRTLSRRFMKPETFRIDELIKISEFLDIKMEIKYEKR